MMGRWSADGWEGEYKMVGRGSVRWLEGGV